MIIDIIWLFPILCLLGSILYCSIRLWRMYKEEIDSYAHRILAKFGLWKTGMGRWVRLWQYSLCYILSAILSVLISVAIPLVTKTEVIEQITAFVERLGTVELSKFLATVGFATITVVESLLMYGCDFSKVDRKLSKLQKFVLMRFLPVLIWVFAGVFVYKDYFFRAAEEWISSPGRVFQLCWGAVSIGIFGLSLCNVIKDMRDN